MTRYGVVFWLNLFSLLLVILLMVYAEIHGPSVSALFHPPSMPAYPSEGFLTRTFQILCSVPVVVCAFSWVLLQTIQPKSKQNLFFLGSALLTGGFLINEIFRIHIFLFAVGVPKLVTVLLYAFVVLLYGLAFRRHIRATPYILLLGGVGLLFFAIAIDSLHLGESGIPSLLEGMPKLFSEINIALYFWYVCHRKFIQILENRKPSLL